MTAKRRLCSIIFFPIVFLGQPVLSAETTPLTQSAMWETNETALGTNIIIDMTSLVSADQREIIKSGFSTFTLLNISETKPKDKETASKFRIVCRVKYDTWEEKYITTKIEPPPVGRFVGGTFNSWSDQCLKYKINDLETLDKLKNGGLLYATLQVRQSSLDESTKIKDWLVKQQSGFMQGLYSHMLGDMQLGSRTDVTFTVPNMPKTQSRKKEKIGK